MSIVTFEAPEVFKADAKDMKSKSEWTNQQSTCQNILIFLYHGNIGLWRKT